MNIYHHTPRRLMALVLALVLCIGMVPSAFAAQEDNYHNPAENWIEALNRTNELDANSVVTIETFNCCECGQATSFEVFRVPEYTRNGETALTRNVKYSDGTCLDGESKGDLLDGTPGKDAYYTGYHWTKAVCQTCGTFNTNMGATNYSCGKNVYWLYDCAADFFEELPETQTIEQVDSEYHRVTTTSGEYCAFCYGTFKEENSTLERHHMEGSIRPELAHDRFVEMDTCADCGYSETAYTAAKSVVADYFGVVDGQPHTVTVSDLLRRGRDHGDPLWQRGRLLHPDFGPQLHGGRGLSPCIMKSPTPLRTPTWWRTAWPLYISVTKQLPGTAPAPAAVAIPIAAARTRIVTAAAAMIRGAARTTTGRCWTA